MMSDMALDARHLLRSLRASPMFAAIAVLTIALGIGVTTAVVSVADHVLVRGLPFRDSGRLMMMLERDEHGGFRGPSAPTSKDWEQDPGVVQAFDGMTFVRGDGLTLRVEDETETVGTAFIAPEFFPLMGVRPAHGRLPVAGDYRADAPQVAVMSTRLWKKRFGADPEIIGRTISIDSIPTTVVGVLPTGAAYPTFADLWVPIAHYRHPEILTRRGLHADSRTVGRLRTGVDSARAAALTHAVGVRLGQAYPREQAGWFPAMFPMQTEIIGNIRPMLLTLAGAAAAVLLLVCANVASLLLARVMTRTRELAVRSALGASRGRLVAQLLTESFVLSALGGAIGIAFTALTLTLARKLAASRLPRADELAVDLRVLAIAALATMLTALLCGLWPALRATRANSGEVLRTGAMGSLGVRSDARLRRLLVTTQFALALMLLVGAGLLLQSFRRAAAVDVGFEPRGMVTLRLQLPSGAYSKPQEAAALYARLMDAARAVPGVVDAAFINHAPFNGAAITTNLAIEGRPALDSSNQILYRTVSGNYQRTMRISMSAGRWFDDAELQSARPNFVINQALAKLHWKGANPVGQRITVTRASQARADFGQPLSGTIVGVIADVHQQGPDIPPDPEVFVPYTVETWPWGNLMVRARDGRLAIPALARAVRSVDTRLVAPGAKGEAAFAVMEDNVASSLGPRKLSTSLIGLFAGCALVLAALGMYGVVAHSVAQRTREIGVRKALGATDRSIVSLIFRESLMVIVAGVLLGCAGAWAGARLIRGLLFDTGLADPVTYLSTVAVLIAVALVATYVPARYAMRLDPTLAMRAE